MSFYIYFTFCLFVGAFQPINCWVQNYYVVSRNALNEVEQTVQHAEKDLLDLIETADPAYRDVSIRVYYESLCRYSIDFETRNFKPVVEKLYQYLDIRTYPYGNAQTYEHNGTYHEECPVSFVKRQLRESTLDEWNRRYVEGTTASVTRVFFPDAKSAYKVIRQMELDPPMVQMLTGHGGFSAYLHRFKLKESPSCTCDPSKDQSVLHLLVDCPKFGAIRVDAEIEMEERIGEGTIPGLMSDKKKRGIFLKFCRMAITSTIEENKT